MILLMMPMIHTAINAEELKTIPKFFVLNVKIINAITRVKRLECRLVIVKIAATVLWDTMIVPKSGLNALFGILKDPIGQKDGINVWALSLVII